METTKALAVLNGYESMYKLFDNLDISELTRQDYCYRIKLFASYCKDNGFNRNSFLQFKRYLAGRTDYTVSTKNKYLATAKVFLKELNRQGQLPADITQNIKSFSQGKKHKKDGLNDKEVMLFADRLRNMPETPKNSRLRAIFCLLALQGMRQIELIRLNVSDLDLASGTAQVQGKGRDDKEIVYLNPETVKALRLHIKVCKIGSGALFTSQSNHSRNKRLTTKSIRNAVQAIFNELGIDKTVHGFRHQFTTKLIQSYKGDLLEVARYTRHRSIEMLQVYNDTVNQKADLPRFYEVFKDLSL